MASTETVGGEVDRAGQLKSYKLKNTRRKTHVVKSARFIDNFRHDTTVILHFVSFDATVKTNYILDLHSDRITQTST